MKTINRNQFIAEHLLREHIQKRIQKKLEEEHQSELKLRKVVRRLLEAETGTEEPSKFTGINVLANVLEKVVPVIEDDYKMLTTSDEQRESFRNHIIHAIKNALRPIETAEKAEDETLSLPENFVFEIETEYLAEKMAIDLAPEEDEVEDVEGEFIDIDAGTEEEQFVQLDDQNETGRNFAASTFKKVEKQIIDAYDMLADEEDQKLFYDYLLTNMLLYFDKFEDELAPSLPDSTTPEYEEEKEAGDEELEGDVGASEEATEEAGEEVSDEELDLSI